MAQRDKHLLPTVDSGDDPAGKVVLALGTERELPTMSDSTIFPTRDAAYDFIVDFYDACSYDPSTDEVFFLRIDRGDWDIHVVETVDHYLGYFANGPFNQDNADLDSVFYFKDVPYRWLPLLKERINHR
jgi:hypothetical protein